MESLFHIPETAKEIGELINQIVDRMPQEAKLDAYYIIELVHAYDEKREV